VSPDIVVLYNGMVKVVDFGIAKANACRSRGGVQGGYCTCRRADPASGSIDGPLSLGIVLWEVLARTPVRRETDLR
jgi:hypothetical protein